MNVSVFPGEQSRCSLCRERLRSQHTHFGQWKSELQQFLLKYTASCVCKACKRNILMINWLDKASKSSVAVYLHVTKLRKKKRLSVVVRFDVV